MPNDLLAGPIVRRATAEAVYIWAATRSRARLRAEVYDAAAGWAELSPPLPPRLIAPTARDRYRIGVASGNDVETWPVGVNLFVNLFKLVPTQGTFPLDALLAYDLFIDDKSLAEQGLIDGPEAIAYDDLALPSFVIATRLERLLHGSCRKLHGAGEDALANADDIIRSTLSEPLVRPAMLFLSGDQIYADDVHPGVYRAMVNICDVVAEPEEIPDLVGDLSLLPAGARQAMVKDTAKLTSGEAGNHALRFGEYAGLYLLAWNPDLSAVGADIAQSLDLYARRSVAAARRALANIATYMLFDDHEITDDWNLNQNWRKAVQASPAGRRIIANGLAAYWAFQGWGNDPDRFSRDFKSLLSEHLTTPQAGSGDAFDILMWGFDRWTYTTPTDPTILALDLRTQRGGQNWLGAIDLLGDRGMTAAETAMAATGAAGGQALVVVSPTPVVGIATPERLQEEAAAAGNTTVFDTESWAANPAALPRFLTFLAGLSGGKPVIFLSGDVHYGFHALLRFTRNGRQTIFAQITSSALKNSGGLPEFLARLDLIQSADLEREVGWDRRPAGIVELLELAVLKAMPEVIALVGPQVAATIASAPLVWKLALNVLAKANHRNDRLVRFDRLFRAWKSMQRSRDPLRLERSLAGDLGLSGWSWESERELVPFTSAMGTRAHIVGQTNLGDVLLLLGKNQVLSLLAQRQGGQMQAIARASLDLSASRTVTASRASGRANQEADRDLARRSPNLAVALHLLDWFRGNADEAWGKPVLPFATFPLELLPRNILPGGRGDQMKCQVHSIAFQVANTSAALLGASLLARFPALIPAAEALAIPNPAGRLAIGSEIRWLINPPGTFDDLLRDVVIVLLSGKSRESLAEPTLDRLREAFAPLIVARDPTFRRFDTRVFTAGMVSESRFVLAVKTLSNHPYGGQRAWAVQASPFNDLYELVTVEFNSYAWLPDLMVEIGMNAGPTRTLWRAMLNDFVAAVGGQATAPPDLGLWNLVRQPNLPVIEDTEFLFPETVNRSPLSVWVRDRFPSIGEMVNSVFGR